MKRVIIVIGISIVSEVAVAQWKFSVSLSMNGCGGSLEERVAVKAAEAQVNHWMGEGFVTFPSKMECEQSRHNVMSFSFNEGNCKIRFIASPCTGSGGMSNDVDVLGVSKGSAFYSTNPVNEINDWSNDDMERMLAFDKNFKTFEPTSVSTGDPYFDNARNRAGSSLPYIGDGVYKGIPNTPLIEANNFGQANLNNVNRYLENSQGLGIAYIANPQDLSLMLQKQYQSLTGYDINAIMNKLDKTDAEKQAIADYNEYAKRMCDQMASEIEQQMGRMDKSEEKKQIDMAIIAKDCYGDDDKGYLGMTDYRRITSDNITDPYVKSIAETIELCNATHNETGFNAVFYYNENTGAYVIGCEGSSMPTIEMGSKYYPSMEKNDETGDITFSLTLGGIPLSATFSQDNISDWGLNNIIQAFGGTAAQFELAHTIGNAINMLPQEVRNNLDLSITGHSLGGGLASVIGLATGKPTYTYNAEGVSDAILNRWGLLEKKQNSEYDITAYHSSTDMLTYAQKHPDQIIGTLAGNPRSFGALVGGLTFEATVNRKGDFENSKSDKSVNLFASEAIGKKVNVGSQGVHQQGPMVEHFIKTNVGTQSEWERIRYSRNSILAAKQDGSLQKVDHINVIFE